MLFQHPIFAVAILLLVSLAARTTEAVSFETRQEKQKIDSNEPATNAENSDGKFQTDLDASVIVLTRRGADALSVGKPDEAVQLFEAVLEKDSDNLIVQNNLAFALLKCSNPDPERALRLVDACLASQTTKFRKYRSNFLDTRGRVLMQLERFEDAIAAFELALVNRPNDLKILHVIVQCYTKTKLDSTGYVERIEQLKKEAVDKYGNEPETEVAKDFFTQAMRSEDADEVADALLKANDWPRDAELFVRTSENRKRTQLADRLLNLGEPASNHRELAINSKIDALAAIYGLKLLHNLDDEEIEQELHEWCERFINDPTDVVQRNARLGLLKYHVFQHVKHNTVQDAKNAEAQLLEVLQRFPDDDVCLQTVTLIFKSSARLKPEFRIKMIEALQSNINRFKGTATEHFILDLEASE